MEKCACFTGHRPDKLFQKGITEGTVRDLIRKEVENAIGEGYTVFYTGMARGVDLIAGEVVLDEKRNNPQIKLISVVPYLKQSSYWDRQWKMRYQKILKNSEAIIYLHSDYCRGCFMERNRFMVEHASLVIAVYNGTPGGTQNTVKLSKKLGKELRIIPC